MAEPSAAQRDVALALRAWLRGDHGAVAQIVKDSGNRPGALLAAMGLCVYFLRQRQDADAVLDVLLEGDPLQDAIGQVSETARAREFLRRELADGLEHSATALRALAISQGIRTTALNNAAYQLQVVRGRRGERTARWSLPQGTP